MTTPKAARAVALGQMLDAPTSLRPVEWSARQDALRCLDRHAPRRQALVEATEKTPCAQAAEEEEEEDCEAVRVTVDGRDEDVRFAALRVALVAAEVRATGRVRAMEDVLHPTRLDAEQRDAAVRAGLAARPVGRYASDDSLLAPDLRAAATAAYARLVEDDKNDKDEDVAEVALATLAWDGFDHVMRQHRPVSAWASHPTVARATGAPGAPSHRRGRRALRRAPRGARRARARARHHAARVLSRGLGPHVRRRLRGGGARRAPPAAPLRPVDLATGPPTSSGARPPALLGVA